MVYSHIKAISSRNIAPLVGILSYLRYQQVSQVYIERCQNAVDERQEVVILPTEFSIEQYKEKKEQLASFCCYSSITIKKNKDNPEKEDVIIGFNCANRCKILNLEIENNEIYVDIELLEIQEFAPEHQELRDSIYENFKEYLKFDSMSIKQIEDVKKSANVDELIKNIILACKFEVSAKRKLTETEDALERLNVLDVELESRLYEIRSDKNSNLITYYKNKINKLNVSSNVKELIYEEFSRLKTINKNTSEFGNIIDWLDRILKLPWDNEKQENQDIELAKKILNESHYGMEKLKEKILEYIALKIISKKTPSSILCLYGPPGVGKSTIAKSIAKALNKDFYGFSLGGVSYPEEINGMKRFYIGAKPGRIMEGITQAGSNNCLILLDEIDKMRANSIKGDPYAVLLDVLDKNQNKEFKDKYFDIPFDLSKVMFIATANSLKTIPEPVLNRLEIINIEGYSINEKVHIARNYTIRKTLKEIGLENMSLNISDQDLKMIIQDYTFESGIRQLERAIETICRKSLIYNYNNKISTNELSVNSEQIKEMLGDYSYEWFNTALEGEIGVVNKMSILGPVGELGRLEITLVDGKGEIVLSDNHIGTAKSTFKTVFGLLMSKAQQWNINPIVFKKKNFYIHSTYHEIKNDGPSGGIADFVCLVSAIKEIPVNHKIAFTGEISLKGKVLAIGGVKEKLLAAQRYKMEKVIVPLQNKAEIEKLSEEIIGNMSIVYVDNIDEVYENVFNNKEQSSNEEE
ncbi:MAG: AAA family ATPase [Clostridia bacterium]|nr:AAA family ATPase [Clostridia bacterium]